MLPPAGLEVLRDILKTAKTQSVFAPTGLTAEPHKRRKRLSSPLGYTIKNSGQLRNKLAVFLCYSQAGLEVLRDILKTAKTQSVFAPPGLTAKPHIAEARLVTA